MAGFPPVGGVPFMVPSKPFGRPNTMSDLKIGRSGLTVRFSANPAPAEEIAKAMALPAPIFRLPKAMLENSRKLPTGIVSATFKNNNSPPTPLVYAMSQITGLVPDIVLMILDQLSYLDLILLALTCKSLAFAVVGDDIFKMKAKGQEEAHSKLGHLGTMSRFVDWNSPLHRSALMCPYFTCPFHMRKARNWAKEIKEKMRQLRAERVAKGETLEIPKQLPPMKALTATMSAGLEAPERSHIRDGQQLDD